MKSNLRWYLPWQLRDFLRDKGIALLLVGLLIGFAAVGSLRLVSGELDDIVMAQMLTAAVSEIPFISAFIALNGIVSSDRKRGYYRFLFSKPVSVPAYYAQLLLVHFVGFLIVCAVLLGVFAILVAPVAFLRPLAFCALVFLSFAGTAFLVSTLFRMDWPIVAAIFLGASVLHSMWRFKDGVRRMILSVLPPVYHLPDLLTPIMERGTIPTQPALWLLGYSALTFVAGLIVLQRRPFG